MAKESESCGKCDDTFTLRLPHHLKIQADKLPLEKKHILLHNLRVEIARAVHNAKFNEYDYLLGEE